MDIGDVSKTVEEEATTGGEAESTAAEYARRAVQSGALAGVAGGLLLLRGVRAFRGGRRVRGIVQVLAGAGLVAVAFRQRRRSPVDETDVVDTSPDIEDVADDADVGESVAGGDEAEAVVDTGPDVEDAVEQSSASPRSTPSHEDAVEQSSTSPRSQTREDVADDAGDAPEGEADAEEADAEEADVDQTDVAGSGVDQEEVRQAVREVDDE